MIVRDFNKIVANEKDRVVSDANWTSVRMLLADDNMGFSFHITFLEEESEHTFEYKNHFEKRLLHRGHRIDHRYCHLANPPYRTQGNAGARQA